MSAIHTDIGVSIKDHVGQIEIQRPPHNRSEEHTSELQSQR